MAGSDQSWQSQVWESESSCLLWPLPGYQRDDLRNLFEERRLHNVSNCLPKILSPGRSGYWDFQKLKDSPNTQ